MTYEPFFSLRILFGMLLSALVALSGCLSVETPRSKEPSPKVDYSFQSIALLPVQFVKNQPDALCHEDIGDDLRSTIALRLRGWGYRVENVTDRRPLSFALDPPPPDPWIAPDLLALAPAGTDTAIGLWVEDYLATTLCEGIREPKQLDMNVLAVLYTLPDGRELGRWRGRGWDMGMGPSQDTVWRVTRELADQLLVGIP